VSKKFEKFETFGYASHSSLPRTLLSALRAISRYLLGYLDVGPSGIFDRVKMFLILRLLQLAAEKY
jgi:hypothetical protein